MLVLHLPQLVGLALGLEPKDLGFARHIVRPSSVIWYSTRGGISAWYVRAISLSHSSWRSRWAELLAKGWGERHPLYSPGVNAVMLYAPRDAGP